jgi:hypothetical protein
LAFTQPATSFQLTHDDGNRFIYARTPKGMTIELISYPSPMGYQQHSDARRWTPPVEQKPRTGPCRTR